jgi:phosphoenolpyruvate phosphomutase
MIGVSAIVIEDKKGFKINSLFENNKNQEQENILEFSKKIKIIKENSITQNLFVIARIESLILDKGLPDALTRARAYVESGADIILIHSKKNKPDEILEFSSLFKKDFPSVPLAVIPTTYNEIYAEELFKNNFDLIIYANQLIRAAYKSMKDVAFEILKNERSFEVEDKLEKIQTIINLLE